MSFLISCNFCLKNSPITYDSQKIEGFLTNCEFWMEEVLRKIDSLELDFDATDFIEIQRCSEQCLEKSGHTTRHVLTKQEHDCFCRWEIEPWANYRRQLLRAHGVGGAPS